MRTASAILTAAGVLALAPSARSDDGLAMVHAAALAGEAGFAVDHCGWHVSKIQLAGAIFNTGVSIRGHEDEIRTKAARIEEALRESGDDAAVCDGIWLELGPSGSIAKDVLSLD